MQFLFNSLCNGNVGFFEEIAIMLKNLWESTGLMSGGSEVWKNYVMILVSFVLFYLAIVKKFEPLLLLPIAFGMFIINLPGAYNVLWGTYPEGVEHVYENVENRGLLWYLFFGVQNVIYPPLIFLGIGVMTDFGPLIANPKSMFMGAAAQLGVFLTFLGAALLPNFSLEQAAAIGIIVFIVCATLSLIVYNSSKSAKDEEAFS
jgi:oxaloacetate decarboxylase beta subunit